VKANSNQAVLTLLGKLGAGADVVSVGEMYRALKAGIAAKDIVFAGVGKTREEMAAALDAGIHQFNVESHGELYTLNEAALANGKKAPVALRINPDVDALTHAKISTGKAENKFGIDYAHAAQVYAEAATLPGIDLQGIACHIGSQLLDIAPYKAAFGKLADLTRQLRAAGLKVQRIDLGGGVGIAYKGEQIISIEGYVEAVASTVGNLGCALEIEPGRSIVAEAGLLIARVINVKSGVSRKFVILDAAMNDLIRPALYDAYHEIVPVAAPANDAPVERVDVVGPVCETGDLFATQRPMPPLASGDLVAFSNAGAYGAVMASTYNSRPLVPEVMVKGSEFAVIRPRLSYDAMIGQDIVPNWF
jgi:diaminopimelate decarboxylase